MLLLFVQRYCKECGIHVGKYKRYCDECNQKRSRWKESKAYKTWLLETDDKNITFLSNADLGDLEYIGGYTGGNSLITLRCKKCGHEEKRYIGNVKSAINGHNAKLKCKNCWKDPNHLSWSEYIEVRHKQGLKQREISRQKHDEDKANRLRTTTCIICGKEFSTLQPSQKTCGPECSKKLRNQRRDHRIPKDAIVNRDITLATLYQRDKGICYICGCLCSWDDIEKKGNYVITGPKYPSVDHIIPISRGGKHSWDNVRLACRECNSIKTDQDPAKFLNTIKYLSDNTYSLMKEQKARKKAVAQYSMDGMLIGVYESSVEAGKKTGYKAKGIQNCARGERKSCHGFLWRYV